MKAHPRKKNKYVSRNKPLVAKVPTLNGDFLNERIITAFELLGGLDKSIKFGDNVMIKPNFNCAYRTPLSTDLGILKSLIEILLDAGAKVSVGESCGRGAGDTGEVIRTLELEKHLKWYGVPFINFEKDEWVEVDIEGRFWSGIKFPRSIYEVEKRVYLPNTRCHSSARFTGAIKLSVGWIGEKDRDSLHEDKDLTEQKIPDFNLGWQPDLILLDARRTTVAWHGRGPYVYPNTIMASGDMVALDSEAVSLLKSFSGENRINLPITEMGQFKGALELDLGSLDYEIVEAPANSETEESENTDPAAIAIMMEMGKEKKNAIRE